MPARVSAALLAADGHAATINVRIEPQAWQAGYKAKGASDRFVDGVDYQRLKSDPLTFRPGLRNGAPHVCPVARAMAIT